MTRTRSFLLLFLAFSLVGGHPGALRSSAAGPRTFAIVRARVFDGIRVVPRATVVVQGGKIAAVGPKVKPPKGAELIDGSGATLLPGFIDAHAHAFDDALERALVFGVTTELDMFTGVGFAQAMREEQARTGAPGRADLLSAGILATVPGGHGTQYGPIPTLARPEEAQDWVDARIGEGSDYIKIISEDGSTYSRERPALDAETIAALVSGSSRKARATRTFS